MDLTFVLKVHNGVQMGLRGIDESLFSIIASKLLGKVLGELQGPTAINTDGSKTAIWSDLGYGCVHYSHRYSIEGLRSIWISYRTNDMLTVKSVKNVLVN
jgi:hypothetical protein